VRLVGTFEGPPGTKTSQKCAWWVFAEAAAEAAIAAVYAVLQSSIFLGAKSFWRTALKITGKLPLVGMFQAFGTRSLLNRPRLSVSFGSLLISNKM
jgi:PIN domain nuclease of toxin-antitoxin system